MTSLVNERGTSTVEAALSTLGFAALIMGICLAFYFSFVNVWLNRQAYEAVICLASTAERSFCEEHLRKDAATPIGIGQLKNFHLNRSGRQASAAFDFKVGEKVVFRFRDSRALPLDGGT